MLMWSTSRALLGVGGILLMASSASAGPIYSPENISNNSTIIARQVATKWHFNCYSALHKCRGDGETSGGGESKSNCLAIDIKGCTRYSFDGGGVWRLLGYLNNECTGQTIAYVNGGKVSCLDAPLNWSGWEIVRI